MRDEKNMETPQGSDENIPHCMRKERFVWGKTLHYARNSKRKCRKPPQVRKCRGRTSLRAPGVNGSYIIGKRTHHTQFVPLAMPVIYYTAKTGERFTLSVVSNGCGQCKEERGPPVARGGV